MPSRRRRPRRLLLPTVLAAVLAAEITGIALARSLVPAVDAGAAPPAVAAATAPDAPGTGSLVRRADPSAADAPAAIGPQGTSAGATAASRGTERAATTRQASRPAQATSRVASGGASRTTTHTSGSAPAAYHGVNHVWIPSLGINKGIQSFPCSRSRPPDAGVYRWGCAGHNNVYLLSHAWSTFKPLHDAYVGGRLHTGMKVVYADGGGHVHTYSVIWWKVVAPTTAAKWAWAALSSPGMTLQTCVGANSAYRLMVRLTRVA